MESVRAPLLTSVMLVVTDLGSAAGYLAMLPILWWSVSWRLAVRLFVALVVSACLNTLLKDTIELPRPFLYADVMNLRAPSSYSFPSGHAQHAAVFWGVLTLQVGKLWMVPLAVAATFLTGVSRIYLGVHFPTDVLAGWCLGAALAWAYHSSFDKMSRWASELPFSRQLVLSLVVPAVTSFVLASTNATIALGGLAGALSGLAIAERDSLYPKDESESVGWSWLVIGLLGLPFFFLLIPRSSMPDPSTLRGFYLWLAFAAVGLWVSLLVPRLARLVNAYSGNRR